MRQLKHRHPDFLRRLIDVLLNYYSSIILIFISASHLAEYSN